MAARKKNKTTAKFIARCVPAALLKLCDFDETKTFISLANIHA
jgi:hypothetical protein